MKRRMWAAALALGLLLSGCSLSGSVYTVVEPHAEHPALGEDASTVKASTYSELVGGVLFFVSQGMEEGIIQLTDYSGDVEEDLNRACLEVNKDDPLGAYAVDFIKNDYTTILTTYEATITISYRRSLEQISSLVNITGTSAIREEAVQALAQFQPELVLRVGYFTGDGAAVAMSAFTGVLGEFGTVAYSIILLLFAFTTVLGWAVYGAKSVQYLCPRRPRTATMAFNIVYIALILGMGLLTFFYEGALGADFVWLISDMTNALMAIPNLIALIVLSKQVVAITENYFARKRGEITEPMLSAYAPLAEDEAEGK